MADVLFLCTGNLCRSPAAARFLEQELARSRTAGVTAHSAGTLGADFGPPESLVKEALDFGIDLGDHRPRRVDRGMTSEADLVVGMSREHVREVVLDDPPTFSKTFTLREIVRRGLGEGPRRTGDSLGEWLERLHDGRRHADLLGVSPDDDIADPMGGSPDDYRMMLTDVSALTRSLRRLAWPSELEGLS